MPNDAIQTLIEQGDFAAIMRECFALLETRHEGVSGLAYRQNVQLRQHLEMVYKAQPRSIKHASAEIYCLAAVAYGMLAEGKTLAEIKDMPSLQLLDAARQLKEPEPIDEEARPRASLEDQLAALRMLKVVAGWERRNGVKPI